MDARTVLDITGFVVLPGVISAAQCRAILEVLGGQPVEGAGTRNLLEADWCSTLATTLRDTLELGSALSGSVAVQCTYFDKSGHNNWLVPLHQDLSIAVKSRVASPELKGWSTKEGTLFVQPPASILEQMIAVRVHLDDSHDDNGPLRVVPGSHRSGRLGPDEQREFRRAHGEVLCTTPRGGVVALKPLLLHASSRVASSRPRRVLHYVFGPRELPHELDWARAV